MRNHKPKILVIGDLMIDEWVYGSVDRISPEAPVPILDVNKADVFLGGAGNVLNNLHSLGSNPMIISGVSDDIYGDIIKKLVDKVAIKKQYFNIPISFKKQRICSGQQQIVRIDTGTGRNISDGEIEEFINSFNDEKIDAVIISDYGKGSVTETVIADMSIYCHRMGIPLLIDPYMRDYYYGGGLSSTLIKFNRLEAENFTGIRIVGNADLQETGRVLMDTFDTEGILITLGPKGMAYFDRKKYKRIPFRVMDIPVHVYDVCGAGDVVIAVLAHFMTYDILKGNMEVILQYAAKAGKLAVSKKGTSVVKFNEIIKGDLKNG